MRVDSKTLSPAQLAKSEDIETLETLGIFCGAGLLLSVLAMQAIRGVDATTRTGDTSYGFDTMPGDFADAEGRAVFTSAASEPFRRVCPHPEKSHCQI